MYFIKSKLFISQAILFITLFLLISSQIPKEKEFKNFLKETLIKFNNRNDNYKTGMDYQSISYEKMKDKPLKDQFQNDIVMIYKTFYPESKEGDIYFDQNSSITEKNRKIIKSFKTLIFNMIDQNLYYNNEENFILNTKLEDKYLWPYPLASAICHGGRTIFLYEKEKINEVKIKEYFFDINLENLAHRSASSHKMEIEKKTEKILEIKIVMEAAMDWFNSLFSPESSPHYGMNIPIGGIGNYWSDRETMISSFGIAIKGPIKKVNDKDSLQHGHLYVRMDNLKNSKFNSIMIGLEEEAPEYKGMFSNRIHDFMSALHAPDVSVCGGNKWKGFSSLGDKIPNNYGGKVVYLNTYPDHELFEKIENFSENLTKKVWWIILSCNSLQYKFMKEMILNNNENSITFILKYIEEKN